jgi:hypothetical protein
MTPKQLILAIANDFYRAAQRQPYMSSTYICYMRAYRQLIEKAAPTGQIKTIVDAIATTRNVTLYAQAQAEQTQR